MGSVTSFPVLCLVNAAICRWTMELVGSGIKARTQNLHDSKLLINGDDACFPTTEEGRHIWARIGSYCGLTPSVGKVYFSERFMNMNSMTFVYRPCTDNTFGYNQVKYINLGLLKGMVRSGDSTGSGYAKAILDSSTVRRDGTFGTRARELISSCPDCIIRYHTSRKQSDVSLKHLVLKYFINFNSGLKEAGVPWFIPERAGGLGLPVVLPKFKPSQDELRQAFKLQSLHKVPTCPVELNWFFWKNAMKKFKPFDNAHGHLKLESFKLSLDDDDLEDRFLSQNDLWGLQVVEQFLTLHQSDVTLNTANLETPLVVRKEFVQGSYGSYLKRLQNLWKRVRLNPAWADFKAPGMILVTAQPTYDFADNIDVFDVPAFVKRNVIVC